MRCKYCNIEIESKTKICPLCHEKLEDIDESLPLAYPEKKSKRHVHRHFTLGKIYTFVSLIVFLLSITVNYLTDKRILWCYIVGAVLLYGLILIKNTVLSRNSVGIKVLVQTVCIFLLFVVIETVTATTSTHWALNYAMPIIHLISTIVLTVLVACSISKNRNNLISVMAFSFLGFLPIILYFATDIVTVLWPAISTCVLSVIAILSTVIFGHNELKNEFKRKFHI